MDVPLSVQPQQKGHDAWHRTIHAGLRPWVIDATYATLQAAVDAAAGKALHITQAWTIDEPLVLPRAATGAEAVHLIGHRGARIAGSADFPEDRALIEWEPVTARAADQRITGLRLDLPNVRGVMAIHYQPTAKSTYAEQNAERMRALVLDDLYITAHNDYHERLIWLEGVISMALIRNLRGDPALGEGTYTTRLLETDTDLPAPSDIANDMVGLMFSRVERLFSMVQRGGKSQLFRGRANGGYFGNLWCNGGGEEPCYEFVNSIKTIIEDTGTEGQGEKPQYRFTNCHFLDGRAINIGTPNGASVGNGLELHGCADCRFDSRYAHPGNPAFSGQGQGGARVTVIDADSARNTFTRWGIRALNGDAAAELQIEAPASAGNRIEWVDVASGATGVLEGVG